MKNKMTHQELININRTLNGNLALVNTERAQFVQMRDNLMKQCSILNQEVKERDAKISDLRNRIDALIGVVDSQAKQISTLVTLK